VTRALRAALLGLALALAALPSGAQPRGTKAPAQPEAPLAPAELEKKLLEQREALEQERARVAEQPPAEVAAELDAIDRTIATYVAYEQILAEADALREREAADAVPPAVAQLGPPPYGLDALDKLQGAIAEAQEKLERLQRSRKLAGDELTATREDFERREEERRKAREAAAIPDAKTDPVAALAARRALRLAELESRRTEIRRDLLAKTAANMEREERLIAAEEAKLRAALARVRANLRIAPDELDARLAKLDELEAQLVRAQEQTQARIAERTTRLARAQRMLEKSTEREPALVAEVAAYRAELQTETQRAALLTEQISHLSPMRETWRERVRVLSGELDRSELLERATRLGASLDEVERTIRISHARLAGLEADARQVRAEAKTAAETAAEVAVWKEREAKALEEGAAAFERDIRSLEGIRALQQRAADDIAARVHVGGWRKPLEALGDGLVRLWDQELTSVDDHPITVGKLVVAVVVLLLGWVAARLLSRIVGRVVRHRSGAAEGAVRAIESLAFYGFLALFFLLALRTVNIPLTAFALAGGALAVGIGFGSQNVVNNFISGLILLTERPIQIGDIIEMDGTQGQVERIGPRSTRLKTFEGVHLIIPNSAFLERNVLNLTLTDDTVRGQVDVGVRYGSDPRAVEEILGRVLRAHPQVLDDPAPGIELAAFGESAVQFRTFFWVRDVTVRGKVASDVRYQLVEELAKAGIELAHPQRDVHLDARRAVPVRLVPPDRDPGPEKG
jgi:small-conductance mechanosensitive channel